MHVLSDDGSSSMTAIIDSFDITFWKIINDDDASLVVGVLHLRLRNWKQYDAIRLNITLRVKTVKTLHALIISGYFLTSLGCLCRKKIKRFLGKTVQKIKTVADEGKSCLEDCFMLITLLCRWHIRRMCERSKLVKNAVELECKDHWCLCSPS